MNLFDLIDASGPQIVHNDTWRPVAPPSLTGVNEVFLNFETTGLKWWEKDRPLSMSICLPDNTTYYLPWAHRGAGNLDENSVKEWARRELRGKKIYNTNTRFDIHMARVWGVDLEAQGNTVSDIAHYAALLDDHRRVTNLDSLIQDYLGETPMPRLDESKMREYSAGAAAPRSMYNVLSVKRLKEVMWPELDAQNLQGIRALEDKVIFATVEMEKNGAPIDMELLERWIKESQKQVEVHLWNIIKAVGFQVNPASSKDVARVFQKLNLPIARTAKGAASFTDEILSHIDHPVIKEIRHAAQLMSLRSKFIVNTQKAVCSDGILRYALHQLRVSKDESADAGDTGTVTGRFSSAKPVPDVGCNIQQRMKAAKQRIKFGFDEDDSSHDDEIFLVRKLHIAAQGYKVLSSDMDQAQYRIFASYANNPKIIKAYQDDPTISFHKFMHELLRPYAALSYRQQKDTNFAYLFGAGLTKMALMLKHITQAEYEKIKNTRDFNNPKLNEAKKVRKIYEREVPEVKTLLERFSFLAKPRCDDRCNQGDIYHRNEKHQGFIETLKGRRMRFPDGNRLHKAFNGADQGTEADYNKTKLVELHEARNETGFIMRITNHDEIVGDAPDIECARKVHEILNRQSFPELRVPLTWSTGLGPNWAEIHDL